jgi:hypothetical protein
MMMMMMIMIVVVMIVNSREEFFDLRKWMVEDEKSRLTRSIFRHELSLQ